MAYRKHKANRAPTLRSQVEDLIIRGSAHQVRDRYLALSKEAQDNVTAEVYRQHAEHYGRLVNESQVRPNEF